ncbi:isoprenoid synthase domain-containing protein [Kockiozyma suomiensis]|uniref:isoprenoid synthase domain-containing protein n=1 Tax=Kockiozyma suomiensis TaxID=1337062 RepID=UPI003343C940
MIRVSISRQRATKRLRIPATFGVTALAYGVRVSEMHSSSRTDTAARPAAKDGSESMTTATTSAQSVASLIASLFPSSGNSSDAEVRLREQASVRGSKAFSDPLSVVAAEMTNLTTNIHLLLGSGERSLDSAAKYYVQSQGKHIRPLLVLLMSRAALLAPKDEGYQVANNIDDSISPLDVLRDFNPSNIISTITTTVRKVAAGSVQEQVEEHTGVLPSQRRLAEITEMIHAASLLHDDVIDDAETRRGVPSGNLKYGNKMSILAGDFLLGRACVSLARLRNAEVTELISTAIVNLVEGEVMQLKNTAPEDAITGVATPATFKHYLDKTYLKTASLMSKSCRGAAVLAGVRDEFVEAAYEYGRNLGMAFQLIDDLLDYTVTAAELGKPAGADLQLGLATAPALFAWQKHPELGPMIRRKFRQPGDVDTARKLVAESDGVEQTRVLAQAYCDKAREYMHKFPNSTAKEALLDMADTVLNRKK